MAGNAIPCHTYGLQNFYDVICFHSFLRTSAGLVRAALYD